MDNLRKLEEIFSHFPGIGPRQAKRFVYYLMNKSPATIKEFTNLVEAVKKTTFECERCHRYFVDNNSKHSPLCSVCGDNTRDQTVLMVVARDSDFETVEKSGAYNGLYFILGGTVPILDSEPNKRIRLNDLLKRISKDKFKEIILSLNTTPDGENTTDILKKSTQSLNIENMKITILGRGLSTGAELEYVDSDTIKNALQNRH